ncbi:hypothetical protein DL93DRAFT_2103577 [Clavulina sp. PMI_390]|nr:hypothetical protein DL93DRAFT_2103577 [Clavulina sp. PMI_390]
MFLIKPSATDLFVKPENSFVQGSTFIDNQVISLNTQSVGVGPGSDSTGWKRMLARVSICDNLGRVVLDTFVQPTEPITKYFDNGINYANLASGSPFEEVRSFVAFQIRDKVIVGFKLYEDLKMLRLVHPSVATRDIHQYIPYRDLLFPIAHPQEKFMNTDLSIYILRFMNNRASNRTATRSSLENARVCLELYNSNPVELEVTTAWPFSPPPRGFREFFV